MNIDRITTRPLFSKQNVGAASEPGFSAKLQQAGAQFESMLLTDAFSKLRHSFSLDESGQEDAGHDTLTGLADQALGDFLASGGGLGIGAMITRALSSKKT